MPPVRMKGRIRTFQVGNKTAKVVEGTFATPNLFRMFSYPPLQGDVRSVLSSLVSIAFHPEKAARVFFGSAATAMG